MVRRTWSASLSAIVPRKAGSPKAGGTSGTTCKTLIEGELSSRFYYLYAEDASSRWTLDGDVNMCVAEKEFKSAGVTDCVARGFQRAGFQEYDTGEQASWMVQLTDESTTGLQKAPGTNSQ
jgi:uncharacterized membrane protein